MTKKMMYISIRSLRKFVFFLPVIFYPLISFTQCAAPINNFPYTQNFETSDGGWTPGGNSPDWAWGAPSKATINIAASGSRCWITGGLNNKAYNQDQSSWLRSPCFNLSRLRNPYIKFKVFWETEAKYDGASFEFSVDNGASWQMLESRDESANCLSEKWFNASPESLSGEHGWSGNVQTSRPGCVVSGGSGGWVTAKHDAPDLAGIPNVMFRFVFAANSGCNEFDGFAVDDFTIEEAPVGLPSFTYSCSSNLRVNFTAKSTLCPTAYSWDFGDPASSFDNTSGAPDPTHSFSAGGKYRVTLTAFGPGDTSATYVLPDLEIIDNITASVVVPLRCNGDTTGSLTVDFVGDSSGINFNWDSDPVQTTRTAVNLKAGDYNVTILNKEGCPASRKITLTEPPPMLYTITTVKPDCSVKNGSIDIAMSGGSPPYTYRWLPAVSTGPAAKNLEAGIYTVLVSDKDLCSKTITIDLPGAGDLKAAIPDHKDVSCFGKSDGMAMAAASGGNAPYAYLWASGGNGAVENNLSAGTYQVAVTDSKGCKAFATAVISQPLPLSSTTSRQNTSCGNNNGSASIQVSGGAGPYEFSWVPGNYTTPFVSNLAAGTYIIEVKDSNNCITIDTAVIAPSAAVKVQVSHSDILCPGEFTGMAEAVVAGGTPPYTFAWTNDSQVFGEKEIKNVAAGTYKFTAADATGCIVTASVVITQPQRLEAALTSQPSYCGLNNGSINALISGGVPPYALSWSPAGGTSAFLTGLHAGNYELTVSDKNNCVATFSTNVSNAEPGNIFLGNDTTLCPGNTIVLSPGTFSSYRWQDNSRGPRFIVSKQGTYSVRVVDDRGCAMSDTIKISADCGLIFFPNAFTPDNDGRNDFFGPEGNLATIKNYSLIIWNRFGQVVFRSNDPYKKWDGRLQNSNLMTDTYIWLARFSNKSETNIVRKGTITILY